MLTEARETFACAGVRECTPTGAGMAVVDAQVPDVDTWSMAAVPTISQITVIENKHRVPMGKPTLGKAFGMLKARWEAGERDLETGLRLMFLAWYGTAEPPYLTGIELERDGYEGPQLSQEVFSFFGGVECGEPELLYVVGVMAEVDPYACGEAKEWAAIGNFCARAARKLRPSGYPPEHYEGRGAYGDYFAHMTRRGVLPGASSVSRF
jgi:hypothetical protein